MSTINFDLPTEPDKQLLTGAIFAESSTKHYGGEHADEKTCIGMCVVNLAFYARQRKPNGGRCYNNSYGSGTILSAITTAFVAYNGAMWNKAMAGNALKSKAQLERDLNADEAEHLRLSIEAANGINILAAPLAYSGFANKRPLQFNQAADRPPSPRTERIGRAGAHTFYGFKQGRECE